ncbi:MAG: hypothetical protein ABGY75_12095, partial [Gemmataceae bacterium]
MGSGTWFGWAVRWWFGFWFGPTGCSVSVWLVWLGLVGATAGFITRYGQNIPSWEEWVFLPGLLGERSRLGWVFERLQEHRYPLGRAASLGLFELCGHDFRAGMYACGVILAAAAAVLLRAAAAVRGRNDYPDILIPALILNPGGYENLILAYQLPFALDVLLAATLVRSAANPSLAGWRILTDAAVVALLALGGWIGLAFVPGGLVWVVWRAWGWYRRGGSVVHAVGMCLPVVVAAVYFAWCYWEVRVNPLPGATANGPTAAVRVAAEFLSGAVGTVAWEGWPWSAACGVGLFGFTTAALIRDMVARPDRRGTAAGWLAVLSAVALMGYGLAQRRPNGFAVRNLPFVALVSVLAQLVVTRWAARQFAAVRITGAVIALPLAVFVYWHGWRSGVDSASPHWERNEQFDRDRQAGLPLNFLASRYQMFPLPELRDSVRLLRDHGHPAATGIPDPPPVRGEPLAVPPPTREPVPGDPFRAAIQGTPRVWKFDLGSERAIVGVRVRVHYHGNSTGVPMHVLWTRQGGGVATAGCRPWMTPFSWEFDFPVDDR